MSILSRITNLFNPTPVRAAAAAKLHTETDNTLLVGVRSWQNEDRDRLEYDREELQELSLEAWRANPIARRIVELTSQFVVGGGLTVTCRHDETAGFLNDFWSHRLNRMDTRVIEWCDELTRTGNLFVLISTDASGMSYVRAVPASDIDVIQHQSNDVEQPRAFYPKASLDNTSPPPYIAYDPSDDPKDAAGSFQPRMIQYAINRPVGAQWGESDLSPLLKWLSRYAGWLEDRARLNRFRTAFMYVVKGRFTSEADRIARQQRLNASPPSPGSILVCDEGEEWDVLAPKLNSEEAATDGLALKKMIASGAGIPLHFLAEPESSTRTTAEAAGGPTYRRFEQRQLFFIWMMSDLLNKVLTRKASVDKKIPHILPEIHITGCDISARDNISLSLAATNITNVAAKLRDRSLIDDQELMRLIYRFSGEIADIEDLLKKGEAAPAPTFHVDPRSSGWISSDSGKGQSVDPETGEGRKAIDMF
jgi:hypothetical protein